MGRQARNRREFEEVREGGLGAEADGTVGLDGRTGPFGGKWPEN
jgi:hypothetical protein